MRIRNLILQDPVALQKWTSIVDGTLPLPSEDKLKIRQLVSKGHYHEGVLRTLQLWLSSGHGFVDFQSTFRSHCLDNLAGTSHGMHFPTHNI